MDSAYQTFSGFSAFLAQPSDIADPESDYLIFDILDKLSESLVNSIKEHILKGNVSTEGITSLKIIGKEHEFYKLLEELEKKIISVIKRPPQDINANILGIEEFKEKLRKLKISKTDKIKLREKTKKRRIVDSK